MQKAWLLALFLLLCSLPPLWGFPLSSLSGPQVLRLDYDGFTVWLDCHRRGAVRFKYALSQDQGSVPRYDTFMLDPVVPDYCQQTSAKPYQHPGTAYDRGHLVPANHMDHSDVAIIQTNYMTNILPQAARMNRGAWLRTEEIAECYRDVFPLLVIGGVIWGNNTNNDYFKGSHGIATPDYFWKIIVIDEDMPDWSPVRVIAWLIPNEQESTRQQLDAYLVSVAELERTIGETIEAAPRGLLDVKPEASWPTPKGCNKS